MLSGSSDPGATAGTVFKGSFTIRGGSNPTGEFTDEADGIGIASCAAAAAKGNGGSGHGSEGSFQVPGPPLVGDASDHVRVSVEAREYAGPGTLLVKRRKAPVLCLRVERGKDGREPSGLSFGAFKPSN